MLKKDLLKSKYSTLVSQTIDAPIMVFDYWELSDVFLALMIILVFGVLFYSWFTMFILLSLCLGIGPMIKRGHPRGIFFHWPYAYLKMQLPGFINPRGERRVYSD
jgi:hypothetical protein